MPKLAALISAIVVATLWGTAAIGTALAQTVAPGAPRQVNVTSDSAAGWIPTSEQEEAARRTATAFLAALDSGKAREAYALLADSHQSHLPYAEFSSILKRFNAQAGPVIERRVTTVTWTKDSPSAPYPGVYAAIDLASRFQRIDRHCGYLILYQPPSGGAFGVMRQEDGYIENASAQKMSKAELDSTWGRLAANCPNFTTPQADTPLPEATENTIGYATVAAALAGLHQRKDVEFSTRDGWTVAFDKASTAVWSFAPLGHAAYPAAVKRQAVEIDGAVSLRMNVLCEADKALCDALVRSFQQLNAQMQQSLKPGQ